MRSIWFWLVVLLHQTAHFAVSKLATPPPLPMLPIPTASQLKWQRRELIMFFHFGINTFTDSEWGSGKENPALFNPTGLNATQWVDAAADAGFSLVILTAKHHDGFCLWPSKYTDHSVASSPWKGGKGDVVQEFADAAKARGIDMGLYLSPWDRHEKTYGLEIEYNEHYLGQLQEHFQDWFSMVKELQIDINIFSDAGPDIRWVGDEGGAASTTCWSTINRTLVSIGTDKVEYLNTGDPRGVDWVPPECDVSIRTGWFWHKNQTAKPLSQLLEIYYSSVGRNCVLLLNVPPNSTGILSDGDVERLKEFHSALNTIFSVDLARGSTAKASSQRGGMDGGFTAANVLDDDESSYWTPEDEGAGGSYWIELANMDPNLSFNVVRIQEAIGMGQRVWRHEIYADRELVANGTTIGYKRLHRLEKAIGAKRVRIRIVESRGVPLLSAVGLHYDPFAAKASSDWGTNNNNGTKVHPS